MTTETNHSDTEELLVYVEFEDSIDIQQYKNINVLGINEKTPIVQMDDAFFSGKNQMFKFSELVLLLYKNYHKTSISECTLTSLLMQVKMTYHYIQS